MLNDQTCLNYLFKLFMCLVVLKGFAHHEGYAVYNACMFIFLFCIIFTQSLFPRCGLVGSHLLVPWRCTSVAQSISLATVCLSSWNQWPQGHAQSRMTDLFTI